MSEVLASGLVSRTRAHLSEPLFRNAYSLMVNSIMSSGLGLVFWIVAARIYPTETVGRDSAMVAAMVTLLTICQLNLGNAIPRFMPLVADPAQALRKLYALSTGLALVRLDRLRVHRAPPRRGARRPRRSRGGDQLHRRNVALGRLRAPGRGPHGAAARALGPGREHGLRNPQAGLPAALPDDRRGQRRLPELGRADAAAPDPGERADLRARHPQAPAGAPRAVGAAGGHQPRAADALPRPGLLRERPLHGRGGDPAPDRALDRRRHGQRLLLHRTHHHPGARGAGGQRRHVADGGERLRPGAAARARPGRAPTRAHADGPVRPDPHRRGAGDPLAVRRGLRPGGDPAAAPLRAHGRSSAPSSSSSSTSRARAAGAARCWWPTYATSSSSSG